MINENMINKIDKGNKTIRTVFSLKLDVLRKEGEVCQKRKHITTAHEGNIFFTNSPNTNILVGNMSDHWTHVIMGEYQNWQD